MSIGLVFNLLLFSSVASAAVVQLPGRVGANWAVLNVAYVFECCYYDRTPVAKPQSHA